jgi:hypothetical protein
MAVTPEAHAESVGHMNFVNIEPFEIVVET